MWWLTFAFAVSHAVHSIASHSFITSQSVLDTYLDQCIHHECDLVLFDPALDCAKLDCEMLLNEKPRPNVPMVFVDVSAVKSLRPSFVKPHTRLSYGQGYRGHRALQQTNFYDYDSVRGTLHEREYKLLITGKPHPDLAHASFAQHARFDDVDHVVAHSDWPHHHSLTRRFLHPHFHAHMVVWMNRTELLSRRCWHDPRLVPDESVSCPGH